MGTLEQGQEVAQNDFPQLGPTHMGQLQLPLVDPSPFV